MLHVDQLFVNSNEGLRYVKILSHIIPWDTKNTFLLLVQKVGVRFAVFVSGRRVHVGVLGQMFGEARELFQTGFVSFVAKERCSFLEQPMGKGRWSVDALNAYGSIVSVSVTPLPVR